MRGMGARQGFSADFFFALGACDIIGAAAAAAGFCVHPHAPGFLVSAFARVGFS